MANVDPGELAKFASRAAEWWDPRGAFRTLHDINELRLDYIAARAPLAGRRVLDVGCGGGLLAEGLAARGASVVAIDLAPENIGAARDHAAGALAIDYRCVDVEQIADRDGRPVRCRHLPRDARARAGSQSRRGRLRRRRCDPAARRSSRRSIAT